MVTECSILMKYNKQQSSSLTYKSTLIYVIKTVQYFCTPEVQCHRKVTFTKQEQERGNKTLSFYLTITVLFFKLKKKKKIILIYRNTFVTGYTLKSMLNWALSEMELEDVILPVLS